MFFLKEMLSTNTTQKVTAHHIEKLIDLVKKVGEAYLMAARNFMGHQ
jgi:hypothetical protein